MATMFNFSGEDYEADANRIESITGTSTVVDNSVLLQLTADWSDERLWRVGLQGKIQWEIVRRRLVQRGIDRRDVIEVTQHRRNSASAANQVPQTSPTFPPEIWNEITQYCLLSTTRSLAATCQRLHQVVNQNLERCMTKAFWSVGLDWIGVRFMLSSSYGLLAGCGAVCLLKPGCGSSTFESLGTMDILAAGCWHARDMSNFLQEAMDWELFHEVPVDTEPDFPPVYWLRRKDQHYPMVIAIQSCRENYRSVFESALTSDFGYFDGTRLVIPYAAHTFNGVAVPNLAFEDMEEEIGPSVGLASEARANRHNIRVKAVRREYLTSPQTFDLRSTNSTDTFIFTYRTRITSSVSKLKVVWHRLHLPPSVLPSEEQHKAAPFFWALESEGFPENGEQFAADVTMAHIPPETDAGAFDAALRDPA
ncbi:hypothetical protein C8F01DRAFT_1345434 [Mycena amicta]|nr:hypothetical protein C8F01DRAFT_1345434 [Mycena amicta]